jgi:hypothetical protein
VKEVVARLTFEERSERNEVVLTSFSRISERSRNLVVV